MAGRPRIRVPRPRITVGVLLAAALLISRELAVQLSADWLKSNLWIMGDFLAWRWSSVIAAVLILGSVWTAGGMIDRGRTSTTREKRSSAGGSDSDDRSTTETEKGFLDFMLDAKKSEREFAQIVMEITKNIAGISSKLQRHTKRITDAGTDVERVHGIARRVAGDLDGHSGFIEAHLRSLREAASAFTDSYFGYIEWFTPETESDRQRLEEFRGTIKGLLEGTRGGRKGISGYRDGVAGLRRRNVSQDLNRATERLVPALDGILKIIGQIEDFCTKLLRLVSRKLAV